MFDEGPRKLMTVVLLLFMFAFTGVAHAKNNEVRFVSIGWTGVSIKTDIAVEMLNSLGYSATNLLVSVPIAYKAMDMQEADVFLGNWMPTMETMANKFFKKGTVVKYVANMPGAKYTLAVPTYVAEGGLKNFSDIAKYADKLEGRIYGLEEGNDGNAVIEKMIEGDMFGLGDFTLVPSSESGMLAQVQSFAKEGKWIVFLGWAPHSMNENIDMTYLDGSTMETFGPNNGSATIYTNVRAGFVDEHPNVGKYLKNLIFPISMMNEIMVALHNDDGLKTKEAGMQWVKNHPEMYEKWLDGVTTADGKPALPAFKAYLETI